MDDLTDSPAEAFRAKILNGADDLSIRVPRPPLKPLPTESNLDQTDEL